MTKLQNNPIEVRCQVSELRANTESRTIVGYAAKFEKWSEPIMGWFREKIDRDAFSECDVTDVIMCFNHNVDSILARTTSGTLTLSTDDEGLRFEFEAPATSLGNDMVELVRRGDISKCSFKFTVEEDEWLYASKENGLEYDERTIRRIDSSMMCRWWSIPPTTTPKQVFATSKNANSNSLIHNTMKKIIKTLLRAWHWTLRRILVPTAKFIVRHLERFIQAHEQD